MTTKEKELLEATNDDYRQLLAVSDRVEVGFIQVLFIRNCVRVIFKESQNHLSAAELTEKIIQLYVRTFGQDETRTKFESEGLTSSAKLGEVVYALCDEGIMRTAEDDHLSDFDGLFDLETLPHYLKKHKKGKDLYNQVNMLVVGVVVALVVLIYHKWISLEFRWFAGILALAAWAMSAFSKKWRPIFNNRFKRQLG